MNRGRGKFLAACGAGVALVAVGVAVSAVALAHVPRLSRAAPLVPAVDVPPSSAVTQTAAPSASAAPSSTATEPPGTAPATQTQPPSASEPPPETSPPVTSPPVSSEGHYVQGEGAAWNLRLVNPWNGMSQAESDTLPITGYRGLELDSRVTESLDAMLAAGSRYGLYVTSAYRSYSVQQQLFENKIGRVQREVGCSYEEAADIAATEVARPGTSEHNTGLAVDLLYDGCSVLEEVWEDGEAFDWMMAHCAEYGFILRFPRGQQDVTGVIYEPWHYRYVGREAASEIMARGITLEQYLQEHGL